MNPLSRNFLALSLVLAGCGSDERSDLLESDAVTLGDTAGSGDVGVNADIVSSDTAEPTDTRTDVPSDTSGDARSDSADDVDEDTDDGGSDATAEPACDDGLRNGDESDVDCGGSCDPCALRSACTTGTDCDSSLCDGGVCVDERCLDGGVSEGETDVDCGGEFCAPCSTGEACLVGDDCEEAVCVDSVCAVPACDDGVRNGRETDVDCGTFCDPCAAGRACRADDDCADGACVDNICVPPTCTDERINGNETGVDCGGDVCDPCAVDQPCEEGTDCESGSCVAEVCAAPSCDDLVINGSETGLDCGGPDCGRCPVGEPCTTGADCGSGVCDTGVCVGAACVDGVRNGSETDVDCGGVDCAPCALGEECLVGADCNTFVCVGNECAEADCGDGLIGAGEECDEGVFNSDVFADSCRTDCTEPSCGDGVRDTGEACDAGDANGSVPDGCRVGCLLPSCGDGVRDSGEECDTGDARSDSSPGACRLNCQQASCGDGVVDPSEDCDDGEANSNSTSGACRLDCRDARCGDGVVDDGEECDNGAANGAGSCSEACERIASSCDGSTADFCVVLPYGSDTELNVLFEDLQQPALDIGFLTDITGSMNTTINALTQALLTNLPETMISGRTGTRFGFAEFSGFDCGTFGSTDESPFVLRQRMTSSLPTFRSILDTVSADGFGDEHIAEALFQYATGLGRSNRSGCLTASEFNPDTQLVRPFNNEIAFSAGIADGSEGGAGFRPNALRPLFLLTDEAGESRSDSFEYGATLEESESALAESAVSVIGIWSATDPISATMLQWARSSAVPACAWNTGRPATCAPGQCCTGVGGAGVAPESGLCPLAYRINSSSTTPVTDLRQALLDGLQRWSSFGTLSTRLRVIGDESWNACVLQDVLATGTTSPNTCSPRPIAADISGTGATDGYLRTPFGADLPFNVALANECLRPGVETRLTAALELRVGDVVLDTRTLEVIIPPRSACVGPSCTIRCGNGAVEPGETCDDGNSDNDDACTNACTLPSCGDGEINVSVNERTFTRPRISFGGVNRFICDEGASCPSGSCSVADDPDAPEHGICQTLGFERASAVVWGEAAGEPQSATLAASSWSCSDFDCVRGGAGTSVFPYECYAWEWLSEITCTGPGLEECDGGPGCSAQCQLPQCGNGVLEFGEQCDDGNLSNLDACTIECLQPVCGDGVVDGFEECDEGDANADSPGTCRTSCLEPVCGDGILDPDEVCDDGNDLNTDSCSNICRAPACGDGIVSPPETCDDGDDIVGDTCPNTCISPFCGDGIVQISRGETCDWLDNPRCSTSSCTIASPAITCSHIDIGSAEGNGIVTGASATAGTNFLPPASCLTVGSPNAAGRDVAFYWIAPRTGTFTFSSDGSSYDTVMSATRLGSGVDCPSVPTVCNDDFNTVSGNDLQGRVSLSVTEGERILLVLDSYGTTTGTYQLSIE